MKAVVHSEFGGPEVLRLEDVDMPAPKAGEMLVKVHAAALNPVDRHFVRGLRLPLRLAAGGRTPAESLTVGKMLWFMMKQPFIRHKTVFAVTKPNRADLQIRADMLAAGAIRAVIDRSYSLGAAADAMRHMESGHAHGKVVVTVCPTA